MKEMIVLIGKTSSNVDYVIRYPKISDVNSAYQYINKLSKEKTYIRFQGEKISYEDEKKWLIKRIKDIKNKKTITLFLIINYKICGICNIDLHDKTESHVGALGLSIDKTMRNQGLGKILIETTIKETKKKLKKLKIITLDVMDPNKKALSLYKKSGFKQYGFLPKGTTYRNRLVDRISMYLAIS
jgi:RimJ/RimL family protein N-acetyltransferase